MEAAKKQKSKNKKKGKADDEMVEEEQVKEPTVFEELFDLECPNGFKKAMKQHIERPFIFGPVEFDDLDSGEVFDYVVQREKVVNQLERSPLMPRDVCIHGFRVKIKQRNLKRKTSLLKHARFLRNLEVSPNHPEAKIPEAEEGEPEENSD